MQTANSSRTDVALAILVPIHGHVALAMEALWSVRGQDAGVNLHTICVVDGDPDQSLARLLTSFASVSENSCSVYWRRNGGLSAARNSAIEVALARFPRLRAVFFLDADNRLGPNALGSAMGRIENGDADILFPDLVNFGLRSSQDTAGPFSLTALMRGNFIDAGSLVSASVLRAGLRFDESLREGYEDWAFWLSAARAGFRFAHDATIGLRYRRRPESMLANTGRQSVRVRAAIETANQAIFTDAGRRRIEATDEPRFALVHVDRDLVEMSSDLAETGKCINIAETGHRLHLHRAMPNWTHFPPLVCFATSCTIGSMRVEGLLPGLLWRLAAENDVAACRLAFDCSSPVELVADLDGPSQIILVRSTALAEAARTQDWQRGGARRFVLTAPETSTQTTACIGSVVDAIVRTWVDMEIAASAPIPWSWRGPVEPRLPVQALNNPFPAILDEKRHLGLILANADNCVWDLGEAGAALKAAGYATHLFARGPVPANCLSSFTTTNFMATSEQPFNPSAELDQHYCGAKIGQSDPRWVAAFGWLDIVVVLALKDMIPQLGALRANGTAIIVVSNSQGDEQRSPLCRDDDFNYLCAAYEHAIDGFVVGGDDAIALTALGIPRSKITVGGAQALVAVVARCCAKCDQIAADAD